MIDHTPINPQGWISEQQAAGRELFLTIDRLAEPDLIPILFGLDLMQDYTNLYTGTDFDDLKDIGPWLIKIPSLKSSAFSFLFDTPEQNWGWLASADKLELTALCTHWRERMLITKAERKALYRFQDNRVIAHHLANLMPKQRPLLMGPLHSLLCWHQGEWAVWDNPTPAVQNSPTSTPWLDIPEPTETRNAIRQHNLQQWLWEQHPAAVTQLVQREPLQNWLQRQLETARQWNWESIEQLHFLLQHQLKPQVANQPFWAKQPGETAAAHYQRCRNALANIPSRSNP